MQGVVFGTRIDEMGDDERLRTRFIDTGAKDGSLQHDRCGSLCEDSHQQFGRNPEYTLFDERSLLAGAFTQTRDDGRVWEPKYSNPRGFF